MLQHLAKKVTQQGCVTATQVPLAAWPWLVRHMVANRAGWVVVVAPEPALTASFTASMQALLPSHTVLEYPSWDVMPYDRLGPDAAIVAARQAVLAALSKPAHAGVIVTSLPALSVRCHPVQLASLELRPGLALPLSTLQQQLVALGYSRVEVVQRIGTFAVRGGLVDCWSPVQDHPVRLDFFDTELEQLRAFDPGSQQSLGLLDKVTIAPAGEQLTEARIATFRTRYRALFGQAMQVQQDELYSEVSAGVWPTDAGQLAPLLTEEPWPHLLAALPAEATLVLPADLSTQQASWYSLVEQAYQSRLDAAINNPGGRILRALPLPELVVAPEQMTGTLNSFAQLALTPFDAPQGIATGLLAQRVPTGNRHTALEAVVGQIQERLTAGWAVVLTALHTEGLKQFLRALEHAGLTAPKLSNTLTFKVGLQACTAPFTAGWEDVAAKVCVLTETDVFGARLGGGKPKARARTAEEILATLSTLKEGDYVVHEAHGIGQYHGLVTLDVGGVRQDFIKVLYAGDDRLFVPVEQLGLVSRYKGAEAGTVALDRLGTGGWETRKAKVKADLLEMAEELLATAAARTLAERPPVGAVGGLYDEFCAGFPYELTADQARVVADVESDFAAGTPMDRLVVGDVGFGKTEVALRAAFLAAQAGRQVAIVCPTTLLARQHALVFTERFSAVGMGVGHLSRLVGPAEAKQTRAALASGALKVVLGTHALLGKELKFANLGLVIVDEEQRFGVAQKEKLKTMKGDVDVLTLSATPIPRTLQLAIGGVRQLSLIATPPVDRHAVQTHVLPWDTPTLQGALGRELGRGGQAYVVAPFVEDLPKLASTIKGFIPHARIAIAHGQMPETELERVMLAFYAHDIDILVATTIIESGLDVPRANTMIVTRADRFGLAQLYQLRGRVGRSTAQAFAYFILPDGGFGQGQGAVRLSLLQQLQGLGAGLTLANYDMDLRGFGNVLGKEQSGNVRDIGFELYAKLLREAVATKQRQQAQKNKEAASPPPALAAENVTLKLGASYLIPASYVPDEALRLQLYRQLAAATNPEALEACSAELRDRFGAHPTDVAALLQVVGLRNRSAALNIAKIEVGDKATAVSFHKGRFMNPEGLIALVQRLAGVVQVRPDSSLVWYRRNSQDPLAGVGVILSELESIKVPSGTPSGR